MASYKDKVEVARIVALNALIGVAKQWDQIPRDAVSAANAILAEAKAVGLTEAKAALADVLEMDPDEAKRLLEDA